MLITPRYKGEPDPPRPVKENNELFLHGVIAETINEMAMNTGIDLVAKALSEEFEQPRPQPRKYSICSIVRHDVFHLLMDDGTIYQYTSEVDNVGTMTWDGNGKYVKSVNTTYILTPIGRKVDLSELRNGNTSLFAIEKMAAKILDVFRRSTIWQVE